MIYLDNAATTKVSEEVFAAIKPFFCEQYANPSAIYSFAGKSMKAVVEGGTGGLHWRRCKGNLFYSRRQRGR